MTRRTLRERLTALDTPPTVVIDHVERPARPVVIRPVLVPKPLFAIGQLVRCANEESHYFDMTGTACALPHDVAGIVLLEVALTSTGERIIFRQCDLVPVVRQPASARRAGERAA